MKKYLKVSFAVLLSLLLLISVTGCQPNTAKQQEKPKIINISYSTKPLNAPAIVALEKQIFEKEFAKDGIQVKWNELEGPATTEALAAKSIDFATSLNYVSAIISNANGNDIKILASYSKFPKGIGLVAAKNGGIASVADLKGKKVALQQGTMLHEMLIKALAEAGLSANDVQMISMASADALNALLQKQVDAAVIPDPLLTKGIASQKITLIRNAEGLIPGQAVIAARTEFIQKYPETTKRFLEIHQQILDWIQENQDEALRMTADTNGMELKAVTALYPKFDFTMPIDSQDIEKLKESAEFLKENSFIKSDVNPDELINHLVDTGYLPK
ncbi:MAG: NrtA/SsuA/CpmA family ABC transporter substrate-binding protein [Dehalobacter sp.]|nr:NrtA/SsuA/CpmA family ABC transporter substrate-binding protein [Dehalobacter sp.]